MYDADQLVNLMVVLSNCELFCIVGMDPYGGKTSCFMYVCTYKCILLIVQRRRRMELSYHASLIRICAHVPLCQTLTLHQL